MSLADYFRTKPAASTPNAQQQQQTPKPGVAPGTDPNALGKKQDTTNADFKVAGEEGLNEDGSPKNPLDSFAGMYDNKSIADGDKPPVFALDSKALESAAQSLQFAPKITPELAQKLQVGDPEALAEVLNAVGRQAYQTAMSHQSVLTDNYVNARLSHDRKGLGQSVHSVLTANKLEQLAEKNPVLKEHVREIGGKIADKYPEASPDWIAEQTRNYFVNIAIQLDPTLGGAKPAVRGNPDEEVDWAKWISAGNKT